MRLSKHNFSSNSIHLRGNIKKWITGFLIIFIVIGINTTYNTYSRSHNISSEEEQNSNKNPSPKTSTGEIASQLRYGTATEPVELDPHYSWDGASINVIDQVCEGLFTYDFSDPELSIIPNLASSFGTWSFDKINYTIPLRIGIKFHDGTPFNATAVKWSFDRLNYFSNV